MTNRQKDEAWKIGLSVVMLVVIVALYLMMPLSAKGQQPVERVTVIERYAAPQPTVTYRLIPVQSAPVVYSAPVLYARVALPVYGKVPVAEYRTGILGLRRNVVHADGTVSQYGPLGRKR